MKVVKAIIDYGIAGIVREMEIEVADWCGPRNIENIIENEIMSSIVYEYHVEEE